METLTAHNKRANAADDRRKHIETLAGVSCPECGKELAWANWGGQTHSPGGGFWLPGAHISVHCSCGYHGFFIKE